MFFTDECIFNHGRLHTIASNSAMVTLCYSRGVIMAFRCDSIHCKLFPLSYFQWMDAKFMRKTTKMMCYVIEFCPLCWNSRSKLGACVVSADKQIVGVGCNTLITGNDWSNSMWALVFTGRIIFGCEHLEYFYAFNVRFELDQNQNGASRNIRHECIMPESLCWKFALLHALRFRLWKSHSWYELGTFLKVHMTQRDTADLGIH